MSKESQRGRVRQTGIDDRVMEIDQKDENK